MSTRKSIKKSRRIEAAAQERFKRFSQASWALSLAEGDEIGDPAPKSEQEKLSADFWDAAEAEKQAAQRLNLRNVNARLKRGKIRKDQIPQICERIKKC